MSNPDGGGISAGKLAPVIRSIRLLSLEKTRPAGLSLKHGNLYLYAHGNPLGMTEPAGLCEGCAATALDRKRRPDAEQADDCFHFGADA